MYGRALALAVLLVLATSSPASATVSINRLVTRGGDGASSTPVISANGRYVAFPSEASNLVRGDANGASDIFVKDLHTGTLRRAGAGFDPPAISADGRVVAYVSNDNNLMVTDMRTGGTTEVSAAAYGSPAISADGRFVAFRSDAVLPGDTNGVADVFLRDLRAGTTTRISVAADGTQGNRLVLHGLAMSADGRLVAFPSAATNLVPGDTNGSVDMFLKDIHTGAIERVNTTADGTQTSSYTLMPMITADGGLVAFVAWGDNLVPGDTEDTPDIFVKNLRTKAITRVNTRADGTVADSQPFQPSISADGRYLTFASLASNLVRRDTNNVDDVFLKDLRTGSISRISGCFGRQGNGFSIAPSISGDGRVVAFASFASNLAAWDRNGQQDVFVHRVR